MHIYRTKLGMKKNELDAHENNFHILPCVRSDYVWWSSLRTIKIKTNYIDACTRTTRHPVSTTTTRSEQDETGKNRRSNTARICLSCPQYISDVGSNIKKDQKKSSKINKDPLCQMETKRTFSKLNIFYICSVALSRY